VYEVLWSGNSPKSVVTGVNSTGPFEAPDGAGGGAEPLIHILSGLSHSPTANRFAYHAESASLAWIEHRAAILGDISDLWGSLDLGGWDDLRRSEGGASFRPIAVIDNLLAAIGLPLATEGEIG
jgi:hypothetical protein